jgi:spore maturation protein CgeB
VKITVFGLTISSSWGNGHATPYRAIFRALHRMGHEVHFFEKDVPYYRSRRDFESCDYCRLTLYADWAEARTVALETADESDVVMTASYLPEGRQVSDEVLELSRPLRVFYDLDTPITLARLKKGDLEYLRHDQIAAFDLVLSFVGGRTLNQLTHEYGARLARPLYGCVDPDVYVRVEPAPEFACDLSYMGTFAPDRQCKLDQLFLEPVRRNLQKQFVLAGSLYPWEWQWPENLRRIEHVSPQAHPRFYSSSQLTLNITREEMARNGWCPSGRFFEAAACGTPLITDAWEGLEHFFDLRHDVRVVSTSEDVENALLLSHEDLRSMARNARRRTLDEHTGTVRARELLQYFEEAMSRSSQIASGEVA